MRVRSLQWPSDMPLHFKEFYYIGILSIFQSPPKTSVLYEQLPHMSISDFSVQKKLNFISTLSQLTMLAAQINNGPMCKRTTYTEIIYPKPLTKNL